MLRDYRIYCVTEGLNKYVRGTVGPTTCPTNAAHTVESASVSMYNPLFLTPEIFGNGADGNVTISTLVLLVRDMYYNNLTLNPGANFATNGSRVFVMNTLTMNGGGMGENGNSAVGSAASGTTNGPVILGYGGSGGAGGVGAANGSNGLALPSLTRLGGIGGAGGASDTNAGGTGGSTSAPSEITGGPGVFRCALIALTGRDTTGVQMNGGSGGGGGGGRTGANGGGGGGGGGVTIIAAREIVYNSGSISANGGAGAAGITPFAGGGGGGGGGIVVVISTSDMTNIPVTATGGLGGVTGGSGVNGANGANGLALKLRV